jgi:hypothetical protein
MLKITHCLGIRSTGGKYVVSLTNRPRSTTRKCYLSTSSAVFCYKLGKPQGLMRPVPTCRKGDILWEIFANGHELWQPRKAFWFHSSFKTKAELLLEPRGLYCSCISTFFSIYLRSVLLLIVHRYLLTWWWRRQVPPKHRFLQEPQCNILGDGILHSHRPENLKSYDGL